MEKSKTVIAAGVVDFALDYRQDIPDDQGLSIQVYAGDDDRKTEILRIDCFDQDPHYHYGPERERVRLPLDTTAEGNALGWALRNFRSNLPAMIRRAGYPDIATAVEAQPVSPSTFDAVEAKARELARTGRRAVIHERGDFIFEAGNVRFGLEFRELSGDRGLAIHVLTDTLGQEVEVLAFDCFENQPHYHYGPREQDVRIFWDKTTAGDTVRWTFDRFKQGRLKAMIERAGYPTVARALDEALIQSLLPTVEAKALALVADHAQPPSSRPVLPSWEGACRRSFCDRRERKDRRANAPNTAPIINPRRERPPRGAHSDPLRARVKKPLTLTGPSLLGRSLPQVLLRPQGAEGSKGRTLPIPPRSSTLSASGHQCGASPDDLRARVKKTAPIINPRRERPPTRRTFGPAASARQKNRPDHRPPARAATNAAHIQTRCERASKNRYTTAAIPPSMLTAVPVM